MLSVRRVTIASLVATMVVGGAALAAPSGVVAAGSSSGTLQCDQSGVIEIPDAPANQTVSRAFGHGTVFSVALWENVSTGYAWERVSTVESDAVVSFVDTKTLRDPSKPALPGSGATRCFRFQAARPGQATITLNYRRSWETVAPIRQVVLKIRVR